MLNYVTVLSLEDRDLWMREHSEGGLPSQSWDYAWALAAPAINPRLAVVRAGGARMLIPFYEREWMGRIDIATVLGLSGASIVPISAVPILHWRQFAIAKGWVAGYIQLSTQTVLSEVLPPDDLVDGKPIFLLDLLAWSPERASGIFRRKLRYAARDGAVLVNDRSVLADRLKSLYPATMRRVGARPHYDFPPEMLHRLSYAPSSLILGAKVDGAIEIVTLFIIAGVHAEFHIAGSTERGRELSAWLHWHVIDRLRDLGVRTLNLGGGARPGDGVYQFKEKFGVPPTMFRAVRQIYDRPTYDELCQRAGVSRENTWFPAYRAPGAPA